MTGAEDLRLTGARAAVGFGTAYATMAAVPVAFAVFSRCAHAGASIRDPSWLAMGGSLWPWALGLALLSALPDRPRFATMLLAATALFTMLLGFISGGVWFVSWVPAIVGFRIGVHRHVGRPIRFALIVAAVSVAVSAAFAGWIVQYARCP